MKTTANRSLVLWLLGLGFLAGLGAFLYGYFFHGGEWAMQRFNKHISGGTSDVGRVLDRNNVVLASTRDGERVYHGDEAVRRAMLHAVGDTNGYISTGVQHSRRSQISAYDPITGLLTLTDSPPDDVTLTLDSRLCEAAWQALDGRNGAAVLYNYETGELLCMVSTPGFDPANVPADVDADPQYEGAYLNKALSSSYTPGSVFKLVTAAAALEHLEDPENKYFTCDGSVVINGNRITCTDSHGRIDMKNGLARSCNVVFAELAVEIGAEKMTATAEEMGFNRSLVIDGIPMAQSVYQVDSVEKDALAWSGVGQYTVTANPCHMLLLMGAIANHGVPVEPYFIKSIGYGGVNSYTGETSEGDRLLGTAEADRLRTLMRYNVTDYYGDGLFPGMSVCAKTGTAEVGGDKEPNAWIVGFSADSRTPYAFAVVVEQGGYGRQTAAPIASTILSCLS